MLVAQPPREELLVAFNGAPFQFRYGYCGSVVMEGVSTMEKIVPVVEEMCLNMSD